MADDIVSFGMEIDSSAARQAKEDLNRLAQSGPAVEQALNRLKGAGASGAAGVSAVSQAAKTVERDMSAARRSAIDFGGALRAVFAGVSIMQVIDTADTWGQFASRMKMATESADEYNHAQDRMVQSAQTTFRSINETRESFIQLSPVLREMGYSLDQSIDAVDAFSGLLVISGANAERGANAMNALAKSLQKGKVDAEAWMTIYTTADSIVTHLAASSGKSANEIRQLGAAGKITGDMLAQALVTGYKPIIKAVEDMPTTVRDAFTNLNTQFTEYVGRANEANGATQGLVTGINALSANFGALADTGLYVVGAALALYTSRTIGAAAASAGLAAAEALRSRAIIGTLKYEVDATAAVVARTRANIGLTASLADLSAAESAHAAATARYAAAQAGAVGIGRTLLGVLGGPVGIVATLGLAAGAAYTFGSKSEAATGGVDALRGSVDLLTVSLKEMGQAALTNTQIKIGDEIDDLGKSAAVTKLKIESLGTQMNAMPVGSPLREGAHREMMQAAEDYETLTGRMAGLINKQKEIDDQLQQISNRRAAGTAKASDPDVAKRLQSMRDELELTKLTGAARARLAAIQKLGANATADERAEAEKLATQIYQLEQSRKGAAAETKKDRIKDLIGSPEIQDSMKQYQKYLDAVEDTQSRLADSQTKYQRELDAMGKGDWARQVNEALQSIEDKYRDILEQRRNSPQGLTEDELKVFQDAMEREKMLAIQHYADLKKIQGDWLLGAQDALANYSDTAGNVYQSIGQMVQNSFRGMEDALTTFVTTGKLSFKDLADSIISDMVRIAIQQSITGPLAGALGGSLRMFGAETFANMSSDPIGSLIGSLGGPEYSAKGNVYSSPDLSRYSGGIYDRPTLFQFAKGAGVFGEAGPEAIMPLKRGPDGRLGVSTQGGGGVGDVTVNVINNSSQPVTAGQPKVSLDSMGRMMIEVMISDAQRNGPYVRQLRGAL